MKTPDRKSLIAMAGERVFGRGEEYLAWGRVRALAVHDGKVSALVDGNRSYRVCLRIDGEPIGHECDCPQGEAGSFCKHCVAACLALAEAERAGECSAAVTLADVRSFLDRSTNAELIELVLDEARRNERFRERLLLRAARVSGKSFDFEPYRRLLQFAAHAAASMDDAGSPPAVLKEVESSLGNLLEAGYAEEVATLSEEALPLIFSRPGQTPASQGLIASLLSFHHRSCRQLRVEPEALARRLFRWQTHPGMKGFAEAPQTYSDLLGKKGLHFYQQLIEAEWDRLQSGGELNRSEDRARFARLTELMEAAANRRGDLESLIKIKSRCLNDAGDYLELARLCKRSGESELALEWALRGKNLFPVLEAEGLYQFLAAEYEERGDWRAALETSFALFSAKPSLSGYQRMAQCARRIGEWEVWRERALSVARQNASATTAPSRPNSKQTKPDQSALAAWAVLASILLWENDDEAAWQAAEQGAGDDDLWLELADRRAREHPEDALLVYRRLVTQAVNRKNNYAYRRAIELLHKIGRLMKKQKRRDEFIDYVERLRHTHRAQRNFARLVDRMMARYYRRIAG